MRLFVIGAGASGSSLAVACQQAGHDIVGIADIDVERALSLSRRVQAEAFTSGLPGNMAGAEVVLLAVPDPVIPQVAREALDAGVVHSNQVWLHLAGAFGADELGTLGDKTKGVGALHPAMVFAPGIITEIPRGTVFAVDGNCQTALDAATLLGKSLRGKTVCVPSGMRPVYHASTVLASNCVAGLLSEARSLLVQNGLGEPDAEEIAVSLAKSAISRADTMGIDRSLSGPIQRGNIETVVRHLAALCDYADQKEIYAVLGRAIVRLAGRSGSLSEEQRSLIEKALNPSEY